MDNVQDTSNTNATLNDTKTNEIAPTTLSVPMEESQGSSDWASTTLDALGPATNTPYPADGVTDTDTAAKSNASEEQASTATNIARDSENQDVPGAYIENTEDAVQGEPSTLLQDAQYVRDMVTETLDHDAQYVKDITAGALEKARNYASKTGEAVGGHLPQSVAAYLPVSPITPQLQHTDSRAPVENAGLSTSEGPTDGVVDDIAASETAATEEAASFTKATENASALPGPGEEDISAGPSRLSSEPSSVEVDPAVRRNALSIPRTFDEPSETMHEGLGNNTADEEKASKSPIADTTAAKDSEPSTHLALPAVSFGAMNGNPEKLRAGTEDTASADASTRSLAGTQVNINDTPGTSVFNEKDAYENQNANDEGLPPANEGDTTKPHTAEPSPLAMGNRALVSDAREYSTAAKQGVGEGVPFEVQQPEPVAALAKESGPASPGAHRFTAESGVTDSTLATPGHGPPVPPPKARPATEKERRTSASAGAGTLAAAGAAGTSVAGAAGGVGAGNISADSKAATHDSNGAVGKDVKGAEAANGMANGSTPAKKHGFFHKLKREFKALGGKHGAEGAPAK